VFSQPFQHLVENVYCCHLEILTNIVSSTINSKNLLCGNIIHENSNNSVELAKSTKYSNTALYQYTRHAGKRPNDMDARETTEYWNLLLPSGEYICRILHYITLETI